MATTETFASPSAKKAKCQGTAKYLRDNIEDRISRDEIARSIWWDKVHWLKKNCWWTYRNFLHWLKDYDFQIYMRFEAPVREWLPHFREHGYHRPHRGRGGPSSSYPVLRTEGATGNNKIGERSPGGDEIAVTEVGDYGIVEFGFGKFIRVVEKEGQYGKFISLERGFTVAGKNDEGKVITDTKTESWFSVPYDPKILDQISSMFEQAAVAIGKIGSEAKAVKA